MTIAFLKTLFLKRQRETGSLWRLETPFATANPKPREAIPVSRRQTEILFEKRSKNRIPKKTLRAFTLIELIVSLAILLILIVITGGILDRMAWITGQTTKRLDSARVARECMDLIGRDLRLATLPYRSSAVDSLQLLINPAAVSGNLSSPHSLFWQAPLSPNKNSGNLTIVGYFVLQDIQTSNPKNTRLQLRRVYIEPDEATYTVYSNPSWLGTLDLSQFAPATAALDETNLQKGWVADGVIAMWIRALDPEGRPISKKSDGTASIYSFNSRESYQYADATTPTLIHYPSGKFPSLQNAVPYYVEVGLICCSPSEMAQIKSLPASFSATNADNFSAEMTTYANSLKTLNPTTKSIATYKRTYQILGAVK